ncbi:hypothetical protein N9B82_04870 [Saprospiraceae bacterium]|nr:hypothetical protein [Saprospiraceae bacterium]
MKSIKVLFLSTLFSCVLFMASASNITPEEAAKDLQKQVSELVLNASGWDAEDIGTQIRVRFMVLSNDEIIVLSTNNEDYDASMKSILNYKKISVDNTLKNKVFILPVRLSN